MSKFPKARIVKIEPGARYMGTIYDQTVIVELPNKIQFGLFDGAIMRCTADMIGKITELVILVPISNIEKISETELRVESSPEKPISYRGHVFYGKIKKIKIKDIWSKKEHRYKNLVLVDVGLGDILAQFDEKLLKKFNEGDYIKISAVRTDLLSIA